MLNILISYLADDYALWFLFARILYILTRPEDPK